MVYGRPSGLVDILSSQEMFYESYTILSRSLKRRNKVQKVVLCSYIAWDIALEYRECDQTCDENGLKRRFKSVQVRSIVLYVVKMKLKTSSNLVK